MFIAHRINCLDAHVAREIFPTCDGIEFDIRDSGGELIVEHDAFHYQNKQTFSDFLTFCRADKFYIVNVKSEGIESHAIKMLEGVGIHHFMLLDCGLPAMHKMWQQGEHRFAVRFSEYEAIETVQAVAKYVQWVWVDVFHSLILTKALETRIHEMGLRICLVSPELQGQPDKISAYIEALQHDGIQIDAVCSKHWNNSMWLNSGVLSPYPSLTAHSHRHH